MNNIILYIPSFIIGFFLAYILFYKSVRKKYSRNWAVTNVVIWGAILTYFIIIVMHLLFFNS